MHTTTAATQEKPVIIANMSVFQYVQKYLKVSNTICAKVFPDFFQISANNIWCRVAILSTVCLTPPNPQLIQKGGDLAS